MKKIIIFLSVFVVLSSLIFSTYAAIVKFYKDDSRILVSSEFDYSVSHPNVTSDDEREFVFPSGSIPRSYDLTFTISDHDDMDIYFAVFFEDATSGISSISSTGGAREMVLSNGGSVNKVVSVDIDQSDSQSVTMGLIAISLAEYNDTSTSIYDSINDETYYLID